MLELESDGVLKECHSRAPFTNADSCSYRLELLPELPEQPRRRSRDRRTRTRIHLNDVYQQNLISDINL